MSQQLSNLHDTWSRYIKKEDYAYEVSLKDILEKNISPKHNAIAEVLLKALRFKGLCVTDGVKNKMMTFQIRSNIEQKTTILEDLRTIADGLQRRGYITYPTPVTGKFIPLLVGEALLTCVQYLFTSEHYPVHYHRTSKDSIMLHV